MLAPKKVQEQYTSTRTTSKMNTHGLLGDAEDRLDRARRPTTRPSSSGARRNPSIVRRENEKREKEKKEKEKKQREKEEKKAKKKKIDTTESAESSSTAVSQASTVASFNTKVEGKQRRHSANQIREVVMSSPSAERRANAYEPSLATTSSETAKAESFDSHRAGSSDQSTSATTPEVHISEYQDDGSMGRDAGNDDDDQSESMTVVTRTPHAEAFTTLDPNVIEYVRSKGGNRMVVDGHSVHWTRRWFPGFGRPTRSITNTPDFPPGPSAVAIEATYTPPWMTIADRKAQETNEKLIQNLNDSFKDVGLLHTFKPPKAPISKGKRNNTGQNLFGEVPEDALYMLLPLWAGETDKASMPSSAAPSFDVIPIEERQYLLVYYNPFEENPKPQEISKKKSKTLTSPETSLEPMDSKSICLSQFRVCARLVGYDELRGSGVRLPSSGLAVTGPVWEAMHNAPSPDLRNEHHDDLVVAVCWGREKGMRFIPEGLVKLGLCLPGVEAEPQIDTDFEPEVMLSPIGRAAVEMIWLGCLALTCFGAT